MPDRAADNPAAPADRAAARTRLLAAGAAAATGVLVGSAIVATRVVVTQTGPASLALLRYVIGFCCLLPPALAAARGVRFERRDLIPLALLGIVQFGLLVALLNYALRFIPSARAALLFATMPLLTMLLGAALGRERVTTAKTAGVLLTIVGVALALGEQAVRTAAAASAWTGDVAALASASCGAVCSVLYRPYLKRYPTLPVSAYAMLAAVVFLAVLAAGEGFFREPLRFATVGVARDPVHRSEQRPRILSLAVGARPRRADRRDRIFGAQSPRRRLRSGHGCSMRRSRRSRSPDSPA